MPIENLDLFVERMRTTGDFENELPLTWYRPETWAERTDGAKIFFKKTPIFWDQGVPRYEYVTIGLDGPHDLIDRYDLTLMTVEFTHIPERHHWELKELNVYKLPWSDNPSEFYVNEISYTPEDNSWRSKPLIFKRLLHPEELKKLIASDIFCREGVHDSAHEIDVRVSADTFLAKIAGWVKDPSSFETANLRPELVIKRLTEADLRARQSVQNDEEWYKQNKSCKSDPLEGLRPASNA